MLPTTPVPPPLSGEPPIGLGAGGKNPGPGGHPGGPLTRRRGPVARGGTRREVLRFRLPYGTPLARHAPPSPTISCSCDVGGQRAVGSPLVSEESAVRAVTKAAAHHQVRRRASAKAQAAQLPSLVGPRLLVHAVPTVPTREVYAGTRGGITSSAIGHRVPRPRRLSTQLVTAEQSSGGWGC